MSVAPGAAGNGVLLVTDRILANGSRLANSPRVNICLLVLSDS